MLRGDSHELCSTTTAARWEFGLVAPASLQQEETPVYSWNIRCRSRIFGRNKILSAVWHMCPFDSGLLGSEKLVKTLSLSTILWIWYLEEEKIQDVVPLIHQKFMNATIQQCSRSSVLYVVVPYAQRLQRLLSFHKPKTKENDFTFHKLDVSVEKFVLHWYTFKRWQICPQSSI